MKKMKNREKKVSEKKVRKLSIFASICKVMQWFLTITGPYVLIVTTCSYVVPMLTATFAGAAGITYDSNYIDVIALMVLPALFAIALLFVGELWLMRWWYQKIKLLFQKIMEKHQEANDETTDTTSV